MIFRFLTPNKLTHTTFQDGRMIRKIAITENMADFMPEHPFLSNFQISIISGGFNWFQVVSGCSSEFELNFQTCIMKNYYDKNLLVLVKHLILHTIDCWKTQFPTYIKIFRGT